MKIIWMKTITQPGMIRLLLILGMLAFLSQVASRLVFAQESSAAQSSSEPRSDTSSYQSSDGKKKDNQKAHEPTSFGGELAEQTREATGAEQEKNANLKYSGMVQLLARKTGLSVRQAHLLALGINFAIIVALIGWAAGKYLPGMFRNRTEGIQQALSEARAASQDANRRLTEIESRLRQLDVEIGRVQSAAEKETSAEEERISRATEEDVRKVLRAAEQEIAAAAKQARRELSAHTADLAIALARKQIQVDPNTDQVLVRTFASHLIAPDSLRNDDAGGKDGD